MPTTRQRPSPFLTRPTTASARACLPYRFGTGSGRWRAGLGATWTQYGGNFTSSPISFDSGTTGGDGQYEFYTRATDNAAHTEAAPASADAATQVVVLHAPVLAAEPPITLGTSNTISWNAVPGASEYYAVCDNNADFSSPELQSGWIPGTQYTFGGLAHGQTYHYRVKARKTPPTGTHVESAWSERRVVEPTGHPLNGGRAGRRQRRRRSPGQPGERDDLRRRGART